MNNSIIALAKKYSINTGKPNFPVNTMRLLYLLIADGLSEGDNQVTDKVNLIIPKISATFDSRDQFLRDNKETNPLLEIQACKQSINDIFKIVNSPIVHHTFDLLFSDLYPLQENLLISLDRHLSEEKLSPGDLASILKIRAMDSVVYSAIIFQIIQDYHHNQGKNIWQADNYSTSPIHWQINTTLQINDIADAVIHAKEDLDANAATIIDVAKRVGTSADGTIKILNLSLENLLKQSQKLPFPQPLQQTINDFNQSLIDRIKNPPQTQIEPKPIPEQPPTPASNTPPQYQPSTSTKPIDQPKIISDQADPESEEIITTQPQTDSSEPTLPEPNPQTPPTNSAPHPIPHNDQS